MIFRLLSFRISPEKNVRRNRAAEAALRTATAKGEIFEDTAILFAKGSGRGALIAFEAEGWIEKVEPITFRQKYRLTAKGHNCLTELKE